MQPEGAGGKPMSPSLPSGSNLPPPGSHLLDAPAQLILGNVRNQLCPYMYVIKMINRVDSLYSPYPMKNDANTGLIIGSLQNKVRILD